MSKITDVDENTAKLNRANTFTEDVEIQDGHLLIDVDGSSSRIGWANATLNNNSGNFKLAINAGDGDNAQVNFTEAGSNRWAVFNEGSNNNFYVVGAAGGTAVSMDTSSNVIIHNTMTVESGVISIKETTTPSADTGYGKLYSKGDNKLYFQDGAGTEHEIAFV